VVDWRGVVCLFEEEYCDEDESVPEIPIKIHLESPIWLHRFTSFHGWWRRKGLLLWLGV
jgi:hypothetical protein